MKYLMISLLALVIFSSHADAEGPSRSAAEIFSGRVVVFYTPSQSEYEIMAKDEGSGIDEVLSDFNYYSGNIMPFLEEHNIQGIYSSANIIKINWGGNIFKFNRAKAKSEFGMIMSDGTKSPKVAGGVDTDEGIMTSVMAFYGIK